MTLHAVAKPVGFGLRQLRFGQTTSGWENRDGDPLVSASAAYIYAKCGIIRPEEVRYIGGQPESTFRVRKGAIRIEFSGPVRTADEFAMENQYYEYYADDTT